MILDELPVRHHLLEQAVTALFRSTAAAGALLQILRGKWAGAQSARR